MIIAIDGPSGTGKSTIIKELEECFKSNNIIEFIKFPPDKDTKLLGDILKNTYNSAEDKDNNYIVDVFRNFINCSPDMRDSSVIFLIIENLLRANEQKIESKGSRGEGIVADACAALLYCADYKRSSLLADSDTNEKVYILDRYILTLLAENSMSHERIYNIIESVGIPLPDYQIYICKKNAVANEDTRKYNEAKRSIRTKINKDAIITITNNVQEPPDLSGFKEVYEKIDEIVSNANILIGEKNKEVEHVMTTIKRLKERLDAFLMQHASDVYYNDLSLRIRNKYFCTIEKNLCELYTLLYSVDSVNNIQIKLETIVSFISQVCRETGLNLL